MLKEIQNPSPHQPLRHLAITDFAAHMFDLGRMGSWDSGHPLCSWVPSRMHDGLNQMQCHSMHFW